MSLKPIKDSFNPHIAISIEEFWKQQTWILFFGFLILIPAYFWEKSGGGIEVMSLFASLFFAIPIYVEFIFTVKRYRAMNIPWIWAAVLFIPPLNLLCFIVATSDEESKIFQYGKKFLRIIKEEEYV